LAGRIARIGYEKCIFVEKFWGRKLLEMCRRRWEGSIGMGLK